LSSLTQFLFEERDARDLAAMRIALGLVLIVWWVALWPDLGFLLSSEGPVDLQLLREKWSGYRFGPFDSLTIGQLQVVHLLGFGAVISFTVGWFTRWMNLVILFFLAAYWHRSPWIQNGGDRLLRIWVLYMCFAPSGRAWSVDAWRGRGASTAPVFATRLIQLQLIVMYTFTGIAKSGRTWHEGSALYYSFSDLGYVRFPEFFDRVLIYRPVRAALAVGSWLALIWELGFGPLVIWARSRSLALWFGVLLHLIIFATLAVGIFSWASLWGYLAFLPQGWAERLRRRLWRMA